MKRLAVPAVLVAAALLVPVSSASAAPPVREPFVSGPMTFPAGAVCSFPVQVDTLVNNQVTTMFFDSTGAPTRMITTGDMVLRISNASTGASVTETVSGPGIGTFNADGSMTFHATGTWLMATFSTDSPPNELFLNSGHMTLELSAEGSLTVASRTGHMTDLCAALG